MDIGALIKLVLAIIFIIVGYFRGRRNERKHYETLEKEEADLADILIFSTRYPPPSAVPLDPVLVSGNAVVASDYFRAFVAGLRKVFGGNYAAYESLLDRGRRQALVRLKQHARSVGATMVFNVKFESAYISDRRRREAPQIDISAYGTAFVLARGSVAQSRVTFKMGKTLPDVETRTLPSGIAWLWILAITVLGIYCLYRLLPIGIHPNWRYVRPLAWTVYIPIALAFSGAGIYFSRKRRMPWLDCIIWGTISLPFLIFSLQFAGLQVNSLGGTRKKVSYTLQAQQQLIPVSPGYPSLDLQNFNSKWLKGPTGQTREIELQKGLLGIWMYNANSL